MNTAHGCNFVLLMFVSAEAKFEGFKGCRGNKRRPPASLKLYNSHTHTHTTNANINQRENDGTTTADLKKRRFLALSQKVSK